MSAQLFTDTARTLLRLSIVLPDGPSVVIIEDDEVLGAAIQQSLIAEGMHAMLYYDPPTPEELERQHPALLIVDCILKTTSGPDYLLKIQGYDGLGQVPVIVTTGIGELADAMAESEYKYRIVRKPFKTQELLSAAREMLEGEAESK